MDIIEGRSLLTVPDPILEKKTQLILEELKMNNLMKIIKFKANINNISVEEQLKTDLYLEKTLTQINIDDMRIKLKALSVENEYLLSELSKYIEQYGQLDKAN